MDLPVKKKVRKVFLCILAALFLGLCGYGFFIEPDLIEVNHVRVEAPGLNKILQGKIAVQLSDLHIKKMGRRERKVLRILDALKPDFIFLTGDYVKWHGDYEAPLTFLSKLKAKIGVWAVMGDYDYGRSRMSCLFCHEGGSSKKTGRHGVRFLRNALEKVSVQDKSVWIGGLDFRGEQFLASKERFLKQGDERPVIMLSHNPLAFDFFDEYQDVFMLSGDTHGGQIPLPSWFWNVLGYEKNALYSYGLFKRGRNKLFVSRGIGTSHLPFRFMRRPEVVVLHF